MLEAQADACQRLAGGQVAGAEPPGYVAAMTYTPVPAVAFAAARTSPYSTRPRRTFRGGTSR